MKTINALDLHKITGDEFIDLVKEHGKIAVVFFDTVIGYIKEPKGKEPKDEITLSAMCRKSKRLLQYELKSVESLKIVHKEKREVIAYFIAA